MKTKEITAIFKNQDSEHFEVGVNANYIEINEKFVVVETDIGKQMYNLDTIEFLYIPTQETSSNDELIPVIG